MPLDFPSSATTGTNYTGTNGILYTFDGIKWVGSSPQASIIPSANLTYDLGSTSSQWRHLYVGTSTIYIGGTPVTVGPGGQLNVNGSPVSGGGLSSTSTIVNGTYTLQLLVDGSLILPTVLAGDTSIGTDFNTNPPGHTLSLKHNSGVNGGSGGELKFDYGNAKIKVVKDAGITQIWSFDTDGVLTIPNGGALGPEGMGASGLSNGISGNPVYIVNKKTDGNYLSNILLTAGDGISGEITFEIWNTQTASTKTLSINTLSNLVFNDGTIYSGSAVYVPYATSSSYKITTEIDMLGSYLPQTFEVIGDTIKLPTGNGRIQSGDFLNAWSLDSLNKSLTFPNNSDIEYGDGTYLSTGSLRVRVDFGGEFTIFLGQPNKTWTFNNSGNIVFPDSSVQSTAYIISAEPKFNVVAASFTATVNTRYGVSTTATAVTVDLPPSPSIGDSVFFADAGGSFSSNNLTINRNGNTIMGLAANTVVNVNGDSLGLFWNGSTWRLYE